MEEIEEKLEMDYQIGEDLKEKVRALHSLLSHWLTLPHRLSQEQSTTLQAKLSNTTWWMKTRQTLKTLMMTTTTRTTLMYRAFPFLIALLSLFPLVASHFISIVSTSIIDVMSFPPSPLAPLVIIGIWLWRRGRTCCETTWSRGKEGCSKRQPRRVQATVIDACSKKSRAGAGVCISPVCRCVWHRLSPPNCCCILGFERVVVVVLQLSVCLSLRLCLITSFFSQDSVFFTYVLTRLHLFFSSTIGI